MLYKYTVNSLSLEARNYILNSIYSSTKKNDIKKNIYIYIYICIYCKGLLYFIILSLICLLSLLKVAMVLVNQHKFH